MASTYRILTAEEAHSIERRFEFEKLQHKLELRFRALGSGATIDLRALAVTLHESTVTFAARIDYRIATDSAVASGHLEHSVTGQTLELAIRDMTAGLYDTIASQVTFMSRATRAA